MHKLAPLMLLAVLSGFSNCGTPEQSALQIAGYTMLSPPSNLFSPGAVVMMEHDEIGRAQLRLLCGPRAALGADFSARVSDTMSSSLKLSKSQRINLEADAMDRFRLRTQMDEVESVSVTFTSPKILELGDDAVFDGVRHRTDACRKAIEARLAGGYMPTVISSAYMADVEYVVTFKREASLSKSTKEKRMKQIAASLGGGHTNITESRLRAINLILAVRSDSYLIHVQDDGTAVVEATPETGLEEGIVEALPGSIAPLVTPEGGWVSPVIGG